MGMPTFGKWEQTVLEKTYENVNFVSCHAYYQPFFKEDGTRDMASFLASGVDMDGFIKDVARHHRRHQGPSEERARRVHLVR